MGLTTTVDGIRRSWNPPPGYEKVLNVGPIALGFWDDWDGPHDIGFRSGRMRWNKDQVFGVAIDGQHRLAAIKSLAAESVDPAVSNSRVPVIFLLFDERVGFQAPGTSRNGRDSSPSIHRSEQALPDGEPRAPDFVG